MIYQYLYARTQSGYQILKEMPGLNLMDGDSAVLNQLQDYMLTDQMDMDSLPECHYAYQSPIANETMMIIGKTTFVPLSSSTLSGSRNTSFVHKYFLSEGDYEDILGNPDNIFNIKQYLTRMEEVGTYDSLTQDVFGTNQLEQLDIIDVLKEFEIGTNDLQGFLYALLDVIYNGGKRIYMMLPLDVDHISNKVLNLTRAITFILPPFLLKHFGFLTYTSGFHNPVNNPIPAGIKMIFVADTERNRGSLEKIQEDHYVFGSQITNKLPYQIDSSLTWILKRWEEKLLTHSLTKEVEDFFGLMDKKLRPDSRISPESLAGLYDFYQIIKTLEDDKITNIDLVQVKNVLQVILMDQGYLSEHIIKDIEEIISVAVRQNTSLSQELMDVFICVYESLNDQKPAMIQYVCEYLYSAFMYGDWDSIETILQKEYHSDMIGIIYDYLYRTPEYYGVPCYLIYEDVKKMCDNPSYTMEQKVDHILEGANNVFNIYPDLIASSDYHNILDIILKELIIEVREIDYDHIKYVYKAVRKFGHQVNQTKVFNNMADNLALLALDVVEEIDDLTANQKNQLKSWEPQLFEALVSPASMEIANWVMDEKYGPLMITLNPIRIVDFCKSQPPKEVQVQLRKYKKETDEIIQKYKSNPIINTTYFYHYFLMVLDLKAAVNLVLTTEATTIVENLWKTVKESKRMGFITQEDDEIHDIFVDTLIALRDTKDTRYWGDEVLNFINITLDAKEEVFSQETSIDQVFSDHNDKVKSPGKSTKKTGTDLDHKFQKILQRLKPGKK